MENTLRIGWNAWNAWCEKSTNRRILAAIITIGSLTFLVKIAGVAKELVVAQQFGTTDELDAFLIAFLLPAFAINVVAGSFNASLIPTFIQVREKDGKNAAQKLFSNIMVWSTVLLLVLSALLALSASYILPILGSGFNSDKLALTRSLFYLLLPILFFNGLATIWASILNAGERFALAAIVPMITPGITVIALIVVGKFFGIYTLVMGTVGGFVLEAGLLFMGLRRLGFSIIPHWHGMDGAIRQVIGQYLPMTAGALLMSSTTLVDQSMAAMLESGSVSILNYGNKVVGFIIGVLSMAMSTAIFPHLSRMVAIGDWHSIRHTIRSYVYLTLLVSIPVTILLVYFSEPLVRLIFERGAFTAKDTQSVGKVQAMYLLQVVFYLLGILFVRLISAMKANRILMCSAMISLPLNIVLNWVLMRYMGVSGIALSTALVYAVSLIFLSTMSYRMMKGLMN